MKKLAAILSISVLVLILGSYDTVRASDADLSDWTFSTNNSSVFSDQGVVEGKRSIRMSFPTAIGDNGQISKTITGLNNGLNTFEASVSAVRMPNFFTCYNASNTQLIIDGNVVEQWNMSAACNDVYGYTFSAKSVVSSNQADVVLKINAGDLGGSSSIFKEYRFYDFLTTFTPSGPTITTGSLPEATVGATYSQILQTSGGTVPFTWNISAGNLPNGLFLNPSTGEISGTPTVVETVNFTVQVTDANNNVATKDLSIIVHGNTPTGSNVTVGPLSDVTLTFSQVIQEGQTTVASNSSGTQPPSGFKLGSPPTYYNISTTAQFTAPVEVCINYDDTQFRNENNLKLMHFENGQWINVTTSLDTISNIICGEVSSFSELALFENLDIDYIIDEVKDFNLDEDIEQGLLDKLTATKSALERGKTKTAINILKAFTNQVKAQKGKKITNEQATVLLNDTEVLINQLQSNSLVTFLKFIFVDVWARLLGLISFNFK